MLASLPTARGSCRVLRRRRSPRGDRIQDGNSSAGFISPTDVDTLVLPSYGLLNARLEYALAKHWTFAAFGTNLANKVYYIGGVDYGANVGFPLYNLGRPREWGLSARYNF